MAHVKVGFDLRKGDWSRCRCGGLTIRSDLYRPAAGRTSVDFCDRVESRDATTAPDLVTNSCRPSPLGTHPERMRPHGCRGDLMGISISHETRGPL